MKNNLTRKDLKEEDQKRLIELLDELIEIFSSDDHSSKIEIIRDIRNELTEIKIRMDEEYNSAKK